MKKLTALILVTFAMAAGAADVNITLTISDTDLVRIRTAVGKAQGLVDEKGVPRAADPTEVKAFMIQRATQLIVDTEGAALTKAAVDAVVVPAFTIR